TKVGEPAQWTQPSAIAESAYAPLVSTANGLASAGATPEQKMNAVIGWTSSNLGAGQITGLDAQTVFETRATTCTGFANTAMAMGRVLGVPARHLANILVGTSQQMHSINKFWLRDSLGSRRVEPPPPASYAHNASHSPTPPLS